MTKKDLAELIPLKNEIRLYKDELHNLPIAQDSVRGSKTDFPYTEHSVLITGIDEMQKSRLNRKIRGLEHRVKKIEDWMDGVEDSEMRSILRLRYQRGMGWQKIAFEIGGSDEQIPRKKVESYLKKYEKYENRVLFFKQ